MPTRCASVLGQGATLSPSPLRGGARGGGRAMPCRVSASIGKPRFENSTNRIRANADRLRRSPAEAERVLWRGLRERVRTSGTHFRRQVPLGPYIADFCCFGARLIVEVDGNQHGSDAGLKSDAERDRYFAAEGFRILRFSNRDVMTALESVLDTIFAALNAPLDRDASTPTPNPSPQGGGEPGAPEFQI